ncbi:MAG: DUF4956 domain-containing protein [Flavobacteriaceae bacterium]|nr:DUF4956 domain-containing protein [Flavobacteriaceae bacterium]
MEILDTFIETFSFFDLVERFFLNFVFTAVIIRFIYYKYAQNKAYMFTYFMISTVVFLLCYSLKRNELDIGLALGLFAVFGIIRYRTDTIDIKEMTYLFVIIGVAVINALSSDAVGLGEILFGNVAVVLMLLILERVMKAPLLLQQQEIIIPYSELVKPDHRSALITSLGAETGLDIKKVQIGKIDLLTQSVKVTLFY